jgi:hypothetical protein
MKSLFCRISKVDEEKRTVTGIGASEAIDAEGEIFDYVTSKPYVEAWSEGAQQRSQGKSFGNIREMHQLSAVGKLSEPIVYDDAQKLIILTSYISDDVAWQKCLDGTYTGFSICGPIVGEKWSDGTNPGVKRYTCAPIEFSVCDLPCNEEAVFTAVKAGGVTEQRKFKTAAAVETEAEVAKQTVAKSLYQIGDLADILGWITYLQGDTKWEAEIEGDNSPIPAKLKSWMAEGVDLLVELAREEGSEAVSAMKAALAERAPNVVSKAKKDPVAKCTKALGSIGECLDKTCKCQDMGKCLTKMCAAHEDATQALYEFTEGDGSEKSAAQKAATVATAAAPIPQQGASPETGAVDMTDAEKAQVAAAETNSAKALEIAEKTNAGMEQIAKALAGLTNLIAGEPVAPKSVTAAAPVAVTKAAEIEGKPVVAAGSTHDVAKSIRSNPHYLSNEEAALLHIGR